MDHSQISILVTGANQGLGFHVVQQLLNQADNLLIYVAARTHEKAADAVVRLEDPNNHARPTNRLQPIVLDLTDDSTIDAAIKQIPTLDILVNNAGAYIKEDFSSPQAVRSTLYETYNTNMFGTAALTVASLPKLVKGRDPAIINVSSGLASLANMSTPTSPQYKSQEIFYSSSKTALNAFTIWLSKQYPMIRVVAVSPGHTATALNGFTGAQSVETGAQFIVDAVLHTGGPSGVHMQRGKQHPW